MKKNMESVSRELLATILNEANDLKKIHEWARSVELYLMKEIANSTIKLSKALYEAENLIQTIPTSEYRIPDRRPTDPQ